jgi:hypothetical protein
MNEKIKQIIDRIWGEYEIIISPGATHPNYGWAFTSKYQEQIFKDNMAKFAEIIIEECIQSVERDKLRTYKNEEFVLYECEYNRQSTHIQKLIEHALDVKDD